MKALVLRGPGHLEVDTVPDPVPSPGELVLRVAACGICGTDLLRVRAGGLPAGSIPGHEFAGEILESVQGFRAGERVCALPALSCGACERCRTGLGAYCRNQRTVGMGTAPGAFADLVAVSAREVVRLPDTVDAIAGALVEPLSVALHAVRVGGLRRGQGCLVLGAGPIGLGMVIWARHFGAGAVVVSDPNPARRSMARALGADAAVVPGSLAEEVATRMPEGPDLVIEAVGQPGLIQEALAAVRFRGRVVVAGACLGEERIRPLPAMARETTVHFVLAYEKDDFQYTVDMLDAGRIEPRPMVTDRVPLEGLPGAFEALRAPSEHGKIVFDAAL